MKSNNLGAILFYEKISVIQLANKTGIKESTVRSYLDCRATASVNNAIKISDFLGYTIHEIWGSECPPEVLEIWNQREA